MALEKRRCDLSDLIVDQCHHCTSNYPTLGPLDGGLHADEEMDES